MGNDIINISKLNLQEKEEYETIFESNEFDSEFYCETYDVRRIDPIVHYIKVGVNEYFNPNLNFDTEYYLLNNPDVRKNKINPFFHYLKFGRDECRIPKTLNSNQIEKLGLKSNQAIHDYLVILNSKLFDYQFYKNTYNLDDSVDFIAHYVTKGAENGFNPNPAFDSNYYLIFASNIKMNPFAHYLKFGRFANIIPKKYTLKELLNLNLKKTIKGKNDFLFVINDSANELRQHFDVSYKNKFNVNEFLDEYYFKKNLFEKNNIDYFYFAIPDKSIVCKDFLPFEVNYIKRNVDEVDEIIDFVNYLNNTCYYKLDSHINRKGGEILTYNMLNYMDNDFTIKEWNNILNINAKDGKQPRDWDLLYEINWSFSEKERKMYEKKYSDYFEYYLKPKNSKDLNKDVPKFMSNTKRPTFFTVNPDGFSDKRILIFRDSSFWALKWYFSFYFKDMCIFWDHGSLDERIIKFYKPDIIMEVRTERFIDILFKSDWVKNKKDIF